MIKDNNVQSILFIDSALTFGGSLVVMGYMVNAIDKTRFRPIVAGETDRAILRNHIGDEVPLYVAKRLFNYTHWAKIKKTIALIPSKTIRKVVVYLLTIASGILNILYVAKIIRIILFEKINIIHINNGMNNLAPIIIAIIFKRKCIVHFHGIETPSFLQRLILPKIPTLIVISEYLKSKLIQNGFPGGKMTVIHNPVQPKLVDLCSVDKLRDQYGIDKKSGVVGIVGRIVKWKGQLEFLKAMEKVLKHIPDLKILIVGEFTTDDILYQQQINTYLKNGILKDRVLFTGYVKDVSAFYQLMDVCVHASIEPEPFGLVITEAMSYGVPVIASDRGAPKEIIDNGENGFICDPESTDQLAEIISSLLLNLELRQTIGINAKRHVLQAYQLKKFILKIEKTYEDI